METAPDLRAAEEYFHAHIPLTRAMGVRVVPDASGFAIEAPVALNYNHLHTAFGGSINSVATLAGYGYLWLAVKESGAHVVVRESSIRFVRPIRERLHAVCVPPDAATFSTFHDALRGEGKARITLRVRVEENALVAAEFTGKFVAFQPS